MDGPDELPLPLDAGLDEAPTFTVGELNRTIAAALVGVFPQALWVRGEVQNLHVSRNGHAYFELIEKDRRDGVQAVVRVAVFRTERTAISRALRDAGVQLTDGLEIRLAGRVDYYPTSGRLQMVMQAVDPAFTIGRMAAGRERLLRALAAEGLLRANAACPVPTVPLRIGLVTSGGSAAYRDFVHELAASPYAFKVAHCDVRVQGAAASRRIAYALGRLAALDLDVVAVVRGGGARSDLAPFDSEVVALAIAAMPVAVFTGIGHETDRSVADEVAHSSFKTPTAVAGALVAEVAAFDDDLARVAHRISTRARVACTVARREVDRTAGHIARRAPQVLAAADARVDAASRRVRELARRRMTDADRALHLAEVRLHSLDPQRVLERGYAILRGADGRVARSVDAFTAGDEFTAELADGRVAGKVETVTRRREALGDGDDDGA